MNTLPLAITAMVLLSGAAHAGYKQIEVPIGPKGTDGTLHLYLFDSRRYSLKIIDQGGVRSQTYRDLEHAMQAHNCVAGSNGGFFGKDGNPLGLVVADGRRSGKPNRASDLTSGVLFQDGARLRIMRASSYFQNGDNPYQLLQTGPFLVENGKAVEGLSAKRHARRTFILTDGGNQWAIGYAPPTTLAQLAATLAQHKQFTPFKVQTALNLDGGSSSGLWVKRGDHLPLYLREIRPIRNFVGILRR